MPVARLVKTARGTYNRCLPSAYLGPAFPPMMLTYRTFRNTDPPPLASIWRSRAGQQALAQPLSVDLLEQYVFAKLYFDYQGLILACDDGEAVGFAHAGFGPDDDEERGFHGDGHHLPGADASRLPAARTWRRDCWSGARPICAGRGRR